MTNDVRSRLQLIVQSFSYCANKLATTMEPHDSYRVLAQEVEKYRATMRVILRDADEETRSAVKYGRMLSDERTAYLNDVASAVNAGLQNLDRVVSQYAPQALAA